MLDPSQRRKPRRVSIVVLAGGSLVSAYSTSHDLAQPMAIDSTPSSVAVSMLFVLVFIFALSLLPDVRRAVRAALPEAVDALIRWLRTIGRG